jgi:hypothetical protein
MAILPIFPLILILMVILAFIFGARKWGKKILLVIPLLLAAFIALFVLRSFSSPQGIIMTPSAHRGYPVAGHNVGHDSSAALPIWTRGIDGHFDADIYPSMQSAAEALAKQVAKSLRPVESQENAKPIQVFGEAVLADGLTHEAIHTFTEQLGTLHPSYKIETSHQTETLAQPQATALSTDKVTIWIKQPKWTRSHRTVAGDIIRHGTSNVPINGDYTVVGLPDGAVQIIGDSGGDVEIAASIRKTASDTQLGTNRSGTLTAEIRGLGNKKEHRVAFTEKPWVENLAGYINRQVNAHRKQFTVSRSFSSNCSTQDEAHREAIQDACRHIERALKNTTSHSFTDRFGINFKVTVNDLQKFGIIHDQFTQSFDGSVGPIWREALLLDESAEKLQILQSSVMRRARSAQRAELGVLASACGLAFIIFLLYIFLNAATKGYYTISLRIVAVLLVLIFCGVMIMLA